MNVVGRGKKRTKFEKSLHQDHSDVYFDNERLDNELVNKIDFMRKEMHRLELQRTITISKIRWEITELRTQHATNANEQLEDIALRPLTGIGHTPRTKNIPGFKQRAKTAWVRTRNNKHVSEKLAAGVTTIKRPDTPKSSVSTLRNVKTLKRYKCINANCFKENKMFPSEWYVKCLPASDAAIYNARKKDRGKSAPAEFDFLSKLREKEEMERKLEQFSKVKMTADNNKASEDIKDARDEFIRVLFEQTVKPKVMSRKQLKEILNGENCVDRGPSRNTIQRQNIKERNACNNRHIEKKVTVFCKKIEDLKVLETRLLKEREEARRKEAQERLYLLAIDVSKLEQEPLVHDNKHDKNLSKKDRQVS